MTVSPPVFTDSVNQQFFVEAQGGSQLPVSYLERFPDALYSKAIDSVLVTFLYALLGPAGAGLLRQEYLEARLQIEDAGLSATDLDALYTNPFAFARLAEETYELDADASLLSATDRAQVLASDAAFRNRAIDFLKGVRAGGTLQGIGLVAKSGLNRPITVTENYRALYDQYSDLPLNLPFLGTTTSLAEVIIQPRQDVPHNAQQTLTILGEPTSGWFTLTLPLGAPYQIVQVGLTNGSAVIAVPDASAIPPGSYVSITSIPSSTSSIGTATPTILAQAGVPMTPTTIGLIYPPTSVNAGLPYTMTTTGSYWAYTAQAETIPLPYNATATTIQNALQDLYVIGSSNVNVTGGPLPDQPVVIVFTNALGDQPIPALQPNLQPGTPKVNGIGPPSSGSPFVSQMTNVSNNPISISGSLTVDIAGASADSQTTPIAPADEHAMQVAIDQIRPQTIFVTTQAARGVTQRQQSRQIFTGSTYTEVLRYETGNAGVPWPPTENLHWIENGREHEAPRPLGDRSHHYQGFHNISSIISYTEAALDDPNYNLPDANHPLWVTYWDTQVGQFSPSQTALYPFLAGTNIAAQYSPSQAIAPSPDPLVITDTLSGTGIINSIYPVDYLSLSGVPPLPTAGSFWASIERPVHADGTLSADYLEVDLGSVQAINYLYFEASSKPYNISVAFDVMDQSPARRFVAAEILPAEFGVSTTGLTYNATVTNPWTTVEIHCGNALGQTFYTRYLRLGFERTTNNSPFAPALGPPIPYSIEIRNLRIGRNITID